MRPVVYSASSVNAYQACHLQWWFTYVLLAEGEQSEAQATGIAVHDAAEKMLRGSWDFAAFWATETASRTVGDLAEVFHRDILPTYRNPVLIEASFQITVNDIPFSGILDAVDEQDVPWGFALILRDLKTTGSRPSPGKYRFAMTGYWLGAADLGYPPDAAQLDYIVRTKNPYYWPEVVDPIDDADIAVFAATLEAVADGVERSDFEATGLGTWACKSCGHRAICGPYQRYEEVNRD